MGCSNDPEIVTDQNSNTSADSFLSSFYSQEYRFGKPIDVKGKVSALAKTSMVTAYYVVTEVFVGNEMRARGYKFTDKLDGSTLCFIDIDRVNYKATTYNYKTGVTNVFDKLNELDHYSSTNELDVMKIILEDPTYVDPPQNAIEGWHYSYGSPYMYNGQCFQAVFRAWYAVGIRFTKWSTVVNANGTGASVSCGSEYNG